MADNLLFYGDNIDVLRHYIKEESVDLVYLDPPFNSNIDYNVLFSEQDRSRAGAQIKAFKDTWHWDQAAARAFDDFVVTAPSRASQALQAFRGLIGENDMLAYLSMMAPRLVELHRVLKPTGSLYLHCDSTACHYLKLLLDSIFGPKSFRNEVIWKRTTAHSDAKQGATHFGRIHDLILLYNKGGSATFHTQWMPYDQEYIESHYRFVEEGTGRRYRKDNLTANKPGGDTAYEWKGVRPYKGRYWAYSKAKMEEFEAQGRLVYTRTGMPEFKRYLDEMPGRTVQDVWDDIPPINARAAERLGYPTQKPEALLERIILTSSNEGDTILDPFCGCGTAVAVAQRHGRRWVGIDITHLAVGLIKTRLHDAYGDKVAKTYKVIGEPVDVAGAKALAELDRYQFQYWALGLVGARPTPADQKKGADKGIDGRLYFHDDIERGKVKQAIFSVKSGKSDVSHVRDLRGVIDREKAEIGVLLLMNEPTGPMRTEAASAGFYPSPWGTKHPRLQIMTVGQLLDGQKLDLPPSRDYRTFKKAPKAKGEAGSGTMLPFDEEGD